MPRFDRNQEYTFRKYFDLRFPVDELVPEFGYSFQRQLIPTVSESNGVQLTDALKQQLERVRQEILSLLPLTDLANEQARREILVIPVVKAVVLELKAQLRIEYAVQVSQYLQGTLDYLIRTQPELLIVEAKQSDLTYGFSQLAAELIALDQWEKSPSIEEQPVLTGIVTTGQVWQFGYCHRESKQIIQDLKLYRVPEDLELIAQLLVQSLQSDSI